MFNVPGAPNSYSDDAIDLITAVEDYLYELWIFNLP